MQWTVSQLDRSLPDGMVMTAHWRLTAVEGRFSGAVYGTVSFPAKDPADPDFTPYEAITEAQAVAWVKGALGEETVAAHEASVLAQIERQKHPTQAAGVPW